MDIVILGGAGFVGSNLARSLLEDGHNVVVVDNLSSGTFNNLNDIESSSLQLLVGDIETWKPPGWLYNVDFVFNLASLASPKQYLAKPFAPISAATTGCMNVINWVKEFDAKLIYSSTSEVYGDPEFDEQVEHHLGRLPLTSDRACYDYAKKLGEVIHYQAKRMYGLDTRVIRIFNTYGPRMNREDGRVVSSFLFKVKEGKSLEIHGDGSQTRSFMYIDDLVEALKKLMLLEDGWDGAVNIGNPTEMSIHEVAQAVGRISPYNLSVEFTDGYPNDPQRRKPCIDKLHSLIEWKPETEFAVGLKATYDWVNKLL